MTLLGLLLLVIGVVAVGWLAYWVITKFFPDPVRMVALCIVGLLLLLVIFAAFFPEVGGMRIWK